MGSWSIVHWLVVLVIVLALFGTKKLRNVGSDLGAAVKGFKDGMKGDEAKSNEQTPAQVSQNQTAKDSTTVDVSSKDVR